MVFRCIWQISWFDDNFFYFPVSFFRSVCLYVLFLIVVLRSLSFQADEDHSGSLEYEEFMQIVTGKKSSSSSDKR